MTNFRTIELSPVPLYTQVKENLRERILDGTYPAHAKLPAESELSTIFGVSRITVRQALSDLQKEGVIFKIPGKGTFVAKPKAFQQLTQLEGFGEAMSRMGYEIYNQVTSHKTIAATPHVAQQLQVAPGAEVTEIKRIRHLNREPVSLEVTYLAQDIGERLAREDLATRDIFVILENDYGIPLGRADLQVDAILADDTLARALRVEQGSAVLRIERLTHRADGAPLDFEYLYFRGDAFQYRLQINRRP
ncbi:GntR family transcriptional regulator [Duganella sp. CF402]|uniref:GntR family transcriptional regulator n=1 Tax=unclassified Duganella TaxID=2636909 RepID=UPI0008B0F84C|nr:MULTISPECIES: GntR family transcriptional regulator [unclassified Duganella]RZT04158.1 GntR family transcriptional regulator [Duganella sp. BK701]SEM45991.1 GntR family transcriptional regulator [Duganella sp. CF402]